MGCGVLCMTTCTIYAAHCSHGRRRPCFRRRRLSRIIRRRRRARRRGSNRWTSIEWGKNDYSHSRKSSIANLCDTNKLIRKYMCYPMLLCSIIMNLTHHGSGTLSTDNTGQGARRERSWTPGRQLSITDITVSNRRIRAVDTDLRVVDEQSEVARVRWREVPPSEL